MISKKERKRRSDYMKKNNPMFKIGARKKVSKSKMGNKNPAKRPEVRKKLSLAKVGKKPWNINKNHPSYNKQREAARKNGLNNLNKRRNGKSELKRQIRDYGLYSRWRTHIFQRDNWTCQTCGIRGCFLEAHHIKSFSVMLKENNITSIEMAEKCEELWDINNGVTLCKDCHELTDDYPKRLRRKK